MKIGVRRLDGEGISGCLGGRDVRLERRLLQKRI